MIRLKELREKSGIKTMTEMAKRIGIPYTTYIGAVSFHED